MKEEICLPCSLLLFGSGLETQVLLAYPDLLLWQGHTLMDEEKVVDTVSLPRGQMLILHPAQDSPKLPGEKTWKCWSPAAEHEPGHAQVAKSPVEARPLSARVCQAKQDQGSGHSCAWHWQGCTLNPRLSFGSLSARKMLRSWSCPQKGHKDGEGTGPKDLGRVVEGAGEKEARGTLSLSTTAWKGVGVRWGSASSLK